MRYILKCDLACLSMQKADFWCYLYRFMESTQRAEKPHTLSNRYLSWIRPAWNTSEDEIISISRYCLLVSSFPLVKKQVIHLEIFLFAFDSVYKVISKGRDTMALPLIVHSLEMVPSQTLEFKWY